jgi:hypothetical protein
MIERSARRHSYTVIDNRPLNDKRLDWDAKGLLAYLLSKPDHWRVDRSHLASVVPSSAGKVQRLLRLLEEAGYLTRERHRDSQGRLGWKHVVHEVAVAPEQHTSDSATTDGATTDGATTDGKPISGADQQERDVPAGGTTDRFSTDGEPDTVVSKEAGITEIASPEEEDHGAAAPDALPGDPSLFQAPGLPEGSPGSHGSSSPHGAAPPPPSASQNGHGGKKAETAKIVQRIFEAFQQGTDSPRAKLTAARRSKITARLREGYTAEQLICVLTDGWRADPWPGRVDNNDLVILLRDGPQVEKFLKLARKAKATTNGNGHHADPAEAERQAREFNARQEARRRAATTTARGARLAVELAARGVSQ